MSDLERLDEAIKQMELRGARVASQAAADGIGTDLVHILAAARAYRDLANGERVELDMRAVAKAHFHYTDPDKRDWDTLPAVLQEDRIREIAVAVHAAIGGKLLVDYPTEEEER